MIDASEVKVALRAHRASAFAAGNSDPGLANPIDRAHIASTAIFNATALMPGEMDVGECSQGDGGGRPNRAGDGVAPRNLPQRIYQHETLI
jgi:hypothetical protein